MANRRRTPPTRAIPRFELLEVQVRSVTIIRDERGNILGKGIGDAKEVHSEQEFHEFWMKCKEEIAENNKLVN